MSKLNPTLTAEVINNDQWKKRFSDDWLQRPASALIVGRVNG